MRCSKCNSIQTKIKEYAGKDVYMGTWVHCRYCKRNTQITKGVNMKADFIFNVAEVDQ